MSKICPTLLNGAGVVTTRFDVHYIVTEFGIADLYGKTLQERAKTLINIAHPITEKRLIKQHSKDLVVTTTSFQNKDQKRKQFASSFFITTFV